MGFLTALFKGNSGDFSKVSRDNEQVMIHSMTHISQLIPISLSQFIGTDMPLRPSMSRRIRDQRKPIPNRMSTLVDPETIQSWNTCAAWLSAQPKLEAPKEQELHDPLMSGCHVAAPLEEIDMSVSALLLL